MMKSCLLMTSFFWINSIVCVHASPTKLSDTPRINSASGKASLKRKGGLQMMTRKLVVILILVLTLLVSNSCMTTPTKVNRTVQSGDYNETNKLIEEGADVNAKDDEGWTALGFASSFGHTDVVELLIAKGADVNDTDNYGITALQEAVLCNDPELVVT